jgi:DNA-binding NarL/FixJ family response regulator
MPPPPHPRENPSFKTAVYLVPPATLAREAKASQAIHLCRGPVQRRVAAALVLTLGTVEKHVASIFGKLRLPACQTDNRRVLAVLRYLGS